MSLIARRFTFVVLACLCAPAFVLAFVGAPARAAARHELLRQITEVPLEGPGKTAVPLPGKLGDVHAMTVDSGELYVADKLTDNSGRQRIDKFDASSGAFLLQFPQAPSLTSIDEGVAVGHGTGEAQVYVGAVDAGGGQVVAVFGATGSLFEPPWSGADTPSGHLGIEGLAVDGSTSLSDWAAGDVYVATQRFGEPRAVDVFKPEPEGKEKYVTQLTGTCALPGTCPGEVIPFGNVEAVAVDQSNGDVVVADNREVGGVFKGEVDVFEPVGLSEYAFVRRITGPAGGFPNGIGGVAVDAASNDIYVAQRRLVYQFSSSGELLGNLSVGAEEVTALAVDSDPSSPSYRNVYVGGINQETKIGSVNIFGPTLTVPDVVTDEASGVGPTEVTLHGRVDPGGEGAASCEFVWGETKEFGHSVPCAETKIEGSALVEAHAELSGLQPDTIYYYRLQASNKNGANDGEESQDRQVMTSGPGFVDESVSNVASGSVNFEARIEPNGAPTSYYFQYGTTSEYGSTVPAAPGIAIGSGKNTVEVTQHVQGLAPGTTYHYRVVAVSELGGPPQTFSAPDRTFATQGVGGGIALADGRQWELVSPPDKHGALIFAMGVGHTQAAASGNAVTFATTAPTEAEPPGFSTTVQVLSARGSEGWASTDISSPHEVATGLSKSEYRFFSSDLTSSVLQPVGPFTASLSDEASEHTAFLHTNLLAGGAFCGEGCYRPLVTGCPPPGQECRPSVQAHANVPPGTSFGEESEVCAKSKACGPEAIGTSPDLKHIVLTSTARVPLTPDAAPNTSALYEWSAGSLSLISLLPDGKQALDPGLGQHNSLLRDAVSTDGSRIVWEDNDTALYLRDMVRRETVRLDAVQGGTGAGPASPAYEAASTDGSRVFFTDDQELTADASNQGNLYECQIVEEAGKLHCRLSDLTPIGASGEPAKVRDDVIGASEDGSWVYFVADGALTPDAARGSCPTGAEVAPATTLCKLYVWHDGMTKLLASLSAADYPDWNGNENVRHLTRVTSRVSPDGRWLTFMSQRDLTGYDTRDVVTGKPDEEVYVYDASAGRLVCASCNPTGARPAGVPYGETLEGLDGTSYKIWNPGQGLAGNLPVWTSADTDAAQYQSRYLLDNGRVFFNSSDGLVPQDVNGVGDVYEFEPAGVGGCSATTSSGTVVFVRELAGRQVDGCVGLVSSGGSSEESGFLDASAVGGRDSEGHEGGGDVFFLTTSQLSTSDFDSSLDVYDAHECLASSPCFPQSVVPPPPCVTADSCKAAPSPQPAVFGSPASATFSGAGNTPPSGSGSGVKPKSLSKAQKLARALKACRKKSAKRKRVSCERRERKRYAASGASVKPGSTRKARG